LEDRTLLSAPQLLLDINPGAGSSNPAHTAVIGSEAYFTANDVTHGTALWKTDGTTAGTVVVKDINHSPPYWLTNVGGTLFFDANDGTHGYELWKSNGSAAGTFMLQDIDPGSASSNPKDFANVNGTLFFSANDGVHGYELWKSDGTPAGTVMVKDINPGGVGSYPIGLTSVNGTVYFSANDGVHGYELWKSDGTPTGTDLVKDLNPGSASTSFDIANFNGTLYFSAIGAVGGLFKSDGTATGTVQVANGLAGISKFTNVDGTLYFSANDGLHGEELYKSDGTAAGTVLVKDINTVPDTYVGDDSSYPSDLTNVNGTLYFRATDLTHGYELWKSDGTTAGTVMIKDILPGASITGFGYSSYPNFLTNVNGTLYFRAGDSVHGNELWQSNGTAAGTTLVGDINPGPNGSVPYYLTNLKGTLLFAANDGTHGVEPWILRGKANDHVALNASVQPSVVGQTITLLASASALAPGAGVPTGSVTFNDVFNGTTSSLGSATLNAFGIARFAVSGLAVGNHTVTAIYSGDSNFNAQNSASFTEVVKQSGFIGNLQSSAGASAFGQIITFTASEKLSSGTAASGTVTFQNGAATLGVVTLNSAGQATFSTSSLAVGNHSIFAFYRGAGSTIPANTLSFIESVAKAGTSLTLTAAPNPAGLSATVTLSATMSVRAPGGGQPTGSVTFIDGTTVLGSGTIGAGGMATFTTSTLTPGIHTITASYASNASYNGSVSAAILETVKSSAAAARAQVAASAGAASSATEIDPLSADAIAAFSPLFAATTSRLAQRR
jgi:ELWxxDGT repeat protein